MRNKFTTSQHSFVSPSYSSHRRKRNKRNPDGKEEVKLSLFTDDMIRYIENPKNTIRKLLELSVNLAKSQDAKSTQKSLAFI